MEPGFRVLKLPFDRGGRNGHGFSGLFHVQSAKEPQFNDATLPRVSSRQLVERFMNGHYLPGFIV